VTFYFTKPSHNLSFGDVCLALAFLAITSECNQNQFGYQNRYLSACQKRKRGIAALDVSNQWIQNFELLLLYISSTLIRLLREIILIS
jgi:hypothetical protein